MTDRPEPIKNPQVIKFGSPSPRNDSALSNKIAVATISDASTMIGESALGRISPSTMERRDLPKTSAA